MGHIQSIYPKTRPIDILSAFSGNSLKNSIPCLSFYFMEHVAFKNRVSSLRIPTAPHYAIYRVLVQ